MSVLININNPVVLDTNVVINNIKNNKYEQGIITDITIFESMKTLDIKSRKERIEELREYIEKSKSIMLYLPNNQKHDIFDTTYPNQYRYKLAYKAAKKAGNYVGIVYLTICVLIAVCYIFRSNDIYIDEKGVGIEKHDSSAGAICRALLISLPIIIKPIKNKIGRDIINNHININDEHFEITYINKMIDIYNEKSPEKYKLDHIIHANQNELTKNGKLTYSKQFIKNILNCCQFELNAKETREIYLELLDGVFNKRKFEFNHIPDIAIAFVAYKNHIKAKSNDIGIKDILSNLNIFIDF